MTLGSHTLGWAFSYLLCFKLFIGAWGDCGLPDRLDYAEPKPGTVDQNTFLHNATVSYDCRPGYARIPGSKNSRTCLEDDTWSTPEVFCQRRSCGNPGEVENGNMEATDFLFGSKVTYTCKEGFRLSSRRNYRECQADGMWSNALPQCDAILCAAPESPENGQYEPLRDEYNYLDSVTFSCTKPFEVAGPHSIACTATGEWSSNSPTCKVVKCSDPDVKNSRRLSGFIGPYTLNSGISFECNKDFVLRGSRSISCNIDSQWVPAIPQCERLSCGDPGTIPNGRVTAPSFNVGSKATYTCNEGYMMNTTQTFRTCQEDGTWSTAIACKEIPTDGPQGLSVGAIVGIIVGAVAVVIVVFLLYKYCSKKQKRGKSQPDTLVQYSNCNA
ncbi:unnamed protein product [Staurois parvus]|uniref:Sushi domain-containing protein n=1 Tax=Staurois parvus TaxID=386267 RepID=A0ABN9ABG1_9NEOB|nr:unnamed protein product [Staurois parvus]